MAETALSLARDYLFPFLMEVGNIIRGVPKDVDDMKNELERIQAIIHDADRVAAAGDDTTRVEVKAKVKLLIEAAFSMEDVIDEYVIHQEQEPRDPGCAAFPCHPADLIETLMLRDTHKIQDVKSRVRAFNKSSERKSDFRIQPFLEKERSSSGGNQTTTLEKIRKAPLYMEEAQIVGFEEPRDELVGWLIKGRAERTVISVVGMGGLGKTTLAKKVFDKKEVIGFFDCYAWTTVSQSYTVDGLLRDILQKFYKQKNVDPPQIISTMQGDSLIDEVRNYLRQKRYVVVFDDVWAVKFWDEIEFATLDSQNGSRIIMTTRDMKVAECCKKSSFVKIHELKPLSPTQSWELFCKKAFQFEFNGYCPAELEQISSEIVEKCEGLPLALVVIAGLLSCKGCRVDEWEEFSQNMQINELGSITKILSFSYYDLPPHLKSCLLYFGIYPEDYEIKSKRLIQQWIAEGFVKEEEGKTLEKVAEGYLKELIDRSLVQVSSLSIDGKVRGCRVHDLTHEMILKKCEDLRFCGGVHDESALSGIPRRLSIETSFIDLTCSSERSPVRSLFVFEEDQSQEFATTLSKYNLLKVLDFDDFYLFDFPENFGNLIHLKYLRISDYSQIKSIPKSIAKLRNLESLVLRGCYDVEIPEEMSKLRKLRHLEVGSMRLTQLKVGIGCMTSLQTLSVLELYDDDDDVELIRGLGRLTQMRKLGLTGVRKKHESSLWSSISKMKYLESVELQYEDEIFNLELNTAPLMLRKLNLSHFKTLPEWIAKLQKLVKCTLKFHLLTEDTIESLKDLPNLLYLLLEFSNCESLHFQNGGFPKLMDLRLSFMYSLNSIYIDKGALSSLKSLKLKHMPSLNAVPSGIQHLKELQVFEVAQMTGEFETNIAPIEGPEHPAIHNVPLVKIISKDHTSRTIHHATRKKS
ncbi:disease resistance protein RPM1-like [Abrus precatorius]|uniref:Disease resistance protein RPM1-like n=1 Tax=Abrus precatorius TaxID=3816 RepID=A0A8B8KDD5_ABRPR|nr:disease resistance protein RPM1-like [Abrus precatorius]